MTEFHDNFEDFFEETLCGFVITDREGSILRVNRRLALWTGQPAESWIGKRFPDLLSIGSRIYYETHLSPLLRMQGFFDEVALQLTTVAGAQKFRVLINALQRNEQPGTLPFTRYTILKATDRLQFEQNLQQEKQRVLEALEEQRASVALREQLIAVLGHDLRNPLTSITMAASLLNRNARPEDAVIIGSILRSGARMEELVRNIMDFARTRLGEKIILQWQEVDPVPLLQQVVTELGLVYPKRTIIADFSIGKLICCDPNRLGQLLSNLVANAITHGAPNLPVFVNASYSNETFALTVVNSGKPIPEHLHRHLFNPFTREMSRGRQDGLGLGLYIATEIANAHNGTLSFTTSEEETSFTFSMPIHSLQLPAQSVSN